jgi:predicted nuclease with RNAse H fold
MSIIDHLSVGVPDIETYPYPAKAGSVRDNGSRRFRVAPLFMPPATICA